jgi:MFS family permease
VTVVTDPVVTSTARRARIGVALLFLTNGALFANLLPRYPAVKAELGLTNTEFGLAVACFPLGALIAGLAAGVLIRRFRSSRVAVAGTILTSAGVLSAGLAPTWVLLAGALFLAGASDAMTDVAQNSHGLRVQRLYRRSIINSFHAIWSIGAVAGGLMGAAAAGFGLPLGVHLGVSAALFSAIGALAYRILLPGAEPTDAVPAVEASATRSARGSRIVRLGVLAALVLLAASGSVVEDAGSSWAALYLSGSLGAATSVAAFGFIALVGMQFVGRMVGDGLVDRFGERTVARVGGLTTAVGMAVALVLPSVWLTIVGFGLAGLGVATLVPAAMHQADRLPGLKPGTGLAVVSWLMRIGFLLSPPIVGSIADATSLRAGLIVVPIAGTAVVLLSGVLATGRHDTADDDRVASAVRS